MSSSQQVLRTVCRKDPEAITLPSKSLDTNSLTHIPNPNAPILTITNDKVLLGMEQTTRNIIRMSSERIHLPRLGIAHPPEFDLTIIRSGCNKGKSRVKCRPINSTIMTFENILDHDVIGSKEFRLKVLVRTLSIGSRWSKSETDWPRWTEYEPEPSGGTLSIGSRWSK